MAIDMGIPFLGRIPIDPAIVKSGDEERPYMRFYPQTETAQKIDGIVERIMGNESPAVFPPQGNKKG